MDTPIQPCNTSKEAEEHGQACLTASYRLVESRNDEGYTRREHERLQRRARVYFEIASTLRRQGK